MSGAAGERSGAPPTLLVIDDDADVRRAEVEALERVGLTVVEAADGVAGLLAARRRAFDAVILDLRMPGLDGLEVLAALRREQADLPVVVVSGQGTFDDAVEALRRGAWDYVQKPFAADALCDAAAQAVARSRQLAAAREEHAGLEALVAERTAALEQRAAALRRLLEQVAGTASHLVELRDPYTAGHMRRVGELSLRVGERLGLEEPRLETLRFAAQLHDLGKAAIPVELLVKPGRLSPAEWGLVKSHAAVGAELLAGIEFPGPVAQVVRQHHERLDGSGYPDGLAGGVILVEAQLVAVADVVEAMATDRPYRAALGLPAARAELTRARGRLLLPDVVDACLEVLAAEDLPWLAPRG